MDMIGKVRRMRMRDQLSLSEIAKRTGLSRNTVKKWLKAPGEVEPKYRRVSRETKLSAFKATLEQSLKADAHRPEHGRRSAKALFSQIQAQGYRGGYSAVTAFVRAWREQSGKTVTKAFVPLSFALGEAFQFDWSDEALVVGGVFYKVQLAHLKLCASRAFWLGAYPSQGHEMLFDAHTRSLAALGGVARRGIYDNMKTAVDKVLKGKGRVVNARFAAMASHDLFDPDFCNVASGWEKGVVEKNVQDSRRRIWIEAGTRRFASFMLELEQAYLMAMPEPFDGYVEKLARVSSTSLVVIARNRYSVPCEWAGHMVSTRLYPSRVDVAAGDTLIASHARLASVGQIGYDWQHYIDLVQRKPGALRNGAPFLDLPPALLRLRQGLLRHPGGDKAMAQVLAAVPQAGLESVLVAAELVLETGAPNGNISVEHVRNVLGRLNTPQIPGPAQTTLSLHVMPKADTARYDRLRPTQQDNVEVKHG
ncbi:MAG: IS21 family transposase [Proteobacteria bacterium]|nr:IS21 family transposase [Pseudomonadota bacterium]